MITCCCEYPQHITSIEHHVSCCNAYWGTNHCGHNITTFSLLDFLTLGSEATDSSGIPGSYSQYSNIIVRKVEWYAGTFSNTQLKKMTQ